MVRAAARGATGLVPGGRGSEDGFRPLNMRGSFANFLDARLKQMLG